MLSSILLCSALAIRAVFANPLDLRPAVLTEVDTAETSIASLNAHPGGAFIHPNGGSPLRDMSSVAHADLEDRAPAIIGDPYNQYIYLCTAANCASCYSYQISTLNGCYTFNPLPFLSVKIVKATGNQYDYALLVGNAANATANCNDLTLIPNPNTCYNINAGAVPPGAINFATSATCTGYGPGATPQSPSLGCPF